MRCALRAGGRAELDRSSPGRRRRRARAGAGRAGRGRHRQVGPAGCLRGGQPAVRGAGADRGGRRARRHPAVLTPARRNRERSRRGRGPVLLAAVARARAGSARGPARVGPRRPLVGGRRDRGPPRGPVHDAARRHLRRRPALGRRCLHHRARLAGSSRRRPSPAHRFGAAAVAPEPGAVDAARPARAAGLSRRGPPPWGGGGSRPPGRR
jgi:hypothetical protein